MYIHHNTVQVNWSPQNVSLKHITWFYQLPLGNCQNKKYSLDQTQIWTVANWYPLVTTNKRCF